MNVTARLIVNMDEGVEVSEFISEMDYSFSDTTGKATVEDTKITDYEVADSK